MFSFNKKYVVLLCMISLSGVALAQKNVIKGVSKVAKKPGIKSPDTYFTPYKNAGELQNLSAPLARRIFLANWEKGVLVQERRQAALERQAESALAKELALTHKNLFLPTFSELKEAEKATQFLRNYLQTHQNKWPVYQVAAIDEQRVLRHIYGMMEVTDPTPTILEAQRQIIQLRAQSVARKPAELKAIVEDMMKYDIIPNRAYLGISNKHTEEELALGEDLAFALLAYQVSMEDNPWWIDGMAELVDKVTTYRAMQRIGPLFEGIPETYTDANGMQTNNIPILTQTEYLAQQKKFAQKYPFTYVLAQYWEKCFGQAFYRIFNNLTATEKRAILFNAPGLPNTVDMQSASFAKYYDRALAKWISDNKKDPLSHFPLNEWKELEVWLKGESVPVRPISFKNKEGLFVEFADLSNQEQVEVLLWIWQKYRIAPQQALKVLQKTTTRYY